MIVPPTTITVCDRCNVTRLDTALNRAHAGDTIVVQGEQTGNFVVRVPRLTIEGGVLDGGGVGTVLTINAPGVTVHNLAVRNSGPDFVGMNTGIRSNAPHTTIHDVDISNTLFGVYLARANWSVVHDVSIWGRKELAVPVRGDGLRVWYSHDIQLSNNHVTDARDDLIWFSDRVTISNNTISGGRYGIHTMYSKYMTVKGNVVKHCEVGMYAMYSTHLRVEQNIFADNRGSTGYGIGLKAMDYSTISDNAFVSNHAAIYLDNSPSLVNSTVRIEHNLLAYNEIGFTAVPSSVNDILIGNDFENNYRQVSVLGGGSLKQLTWSLNGRGNHWSDYAGYDRNGDGIGDIAYAPRNIYGMLSDLNDRLDLLVYSPAATSINFAVNALPMFAPPPMFADASPLMYPTLPQGLPAKHGDTSHGGYIWAGILALSASFAILLPVRPRLRKSNGRSVGTGMSTSTESAIRISNLRKRYGNALAVDGVDLEVRKGETLALWGPNGSGKTTLMRCLLGVVEFEGTIHAPARFGYVPQQLPGFDMRVGELAEFISALCGSGRNEAADRLEAAGLLDLRERNVGELSGGQRQRLSMALAEVGDPDVLLLDEPTVGLDLRSRDAILQRLAQAKLAGKTIVIASHVPGDIVVLADRVAIMEQGRIVGIVSPADFEKLLGNAEVRS